jgi:hypothetical protein
MAKIEARLWGAPPISAIWGARAPNFAIKKNLSLLREGYHGGINRAGNCLSPK